MGPAATFVMGAKSLTVSKGRSLYRCGLTVRMLPEAMSKVYPSGLDRATAAVPTLPPAPSLFSTTTLFPQRAPSLSAIRRPTTSVVPPGENGTTMLTERLGQSAAAAVPPRPSDIPRMPTTLVSSQNLRLNLFITPSVRYGRCDLEPQRR